MKMDILITGGTIIDGTGNPGYPAAIGVRDGRVQVLRGRTEAIEAGRRIDATGLVVAPGFIDLHSHSGLKLLEEPLHAPKISQGVTTELIGVDGLSYAPFLRQSQLLQFVKSNAGLDGAPNLDYDWDTFQSYLSRFEGGASSVNIACLVGNSALRICSVGWDQKQASRNEVTNMRAMLREALEQGAFGLSTGLDYPPGSYASTDELAELCRAVSDVGGIYHTHVRYWLGDRYLDPFRESFHITDRAQTALHITHLHAKDSNPGGSGPIFDLINTWLERGADVTFDNFPYEHGATRLSVYLPQWIQSGGPGATLNRLKGRSARSHFLRELDEAGMLDGWREATKLIRVGGFRKQSNFDLESRTLWEIAVLRGTDVLNTLFDLLVEEELALTQVDPAATSASLAAFVTHPLAMVGTDSTFVGEKPSPRTYGSFPRILGELVREERLLSLADAVRKFTSFPAQRLGLPDRGILRDGFRADITVFDPKRVRALATYHQPRRESHGIEIVLVNGMPVWENGRHTGNLPGVSLRRS